MKRIIAIILMSLTVLSLLSGCSEKKETCIDCKGTGKCSICKGEGEYMSYGNIYQKRMLFCNFCKGTGVCSACDGKKKVSSEVNELTRQNAQKTLDELNKKLNPDPPSNSGSSSDNAGTFKCTFCKGTGINPVYDLLANSVLRPLCDKECPKCGGTGRSK